ncbi:hypothetical protein GCM10027038_01170 [Arthrobacter bambusae]
MAILAEAAESTETISDAERSFLVEQAHIDPALLDQERQADARRRIIVESAQADAAATRDGYTTGEVARLLGTQPANVRRGRAAGDLYASGVKHNRETVFPRWQFRDGRPVPHLRRVIPALPEDMHPLDVEAFMTAPQESLGGRSVLDWLGSGGALEPVLELADDTNRA